MRAEDVASALLLLGVTPLAHLLAPWHTHSPQAASDVYSPLSGEVVEVNEDLVKEGSLVSSLY